MIFSEPLEFHSLSMERVWGGRNLESLYGKSLPPERLIGETWEVVDREEAQSILQNTPLKGTSLHDLWLHHRKEIFGESCPDAPRFPLLIKLLDAQQTLSLQVHPPAQIAPLLGGEPKTEMWYFLHCDPQAHIYAGLKKGYTKNPFAHLLTSGEAEEALHRIAVHAGDYIFIPSGRLHAIGAGSVLAEIQQNSDTTYRVFDWNRLGLDGKPRTLHIDQAMRSIDFGDFEPSLGKAQGELLVSCPSFQVDLWKLIHPKKTLTKDTFSLFLCTQGSVEILGKSYHAGETFLLPACLAGSEIAPKGQTAQVLHIHIPTSEIETNPSGPSCVSM